MTRLGGPGKFDFDTRRGVIRWVSKQPMNREFTYRDVYKEVGWGYSVIQLAMKELELAGYVKAYRPNPRRTYWRKAKSMRKTDDVLIAMLETRNRCPHCGKLLGVKVLES